MLADATCRLLVENAHLICGRHGNGAARRKKVLTTDKPKNPYQKGTLIWSVMEGDWEDLTVTQIAEVLGTTPDNIGAYTSRIKRETGYVVPRLRGKTWRKADE